ncbi:hypothetical protein [Nodosilinea nodulosa]|uniref:hypothetical protein n=1 Tax=Nodosilinea nodulosa TaxID=416001 RepID=UPI000367ED52|nr:hypothetical protein [Nodosilinea nodulosa]
MAGLWKIGANVEVSKMAMDWDVLKAQYLRADQATQLGNLALNLTRIQICAQSGTNGPVAQHLVRETQFFIEWIVPSIDLWTNETFATELVDMQRLLSRWKLNWSELWTDESKRQEIAMLAQQWFDYIREQYDLIVD